MHEEIEVVWVTVLECAWLIHYANYNRVETMGTTAGHLLLPCRDSEYLMTLIRCHNDPSQHLFPGGAEVVYSSDVYRTCSWCHLIHLNH